MPSDEKKVLVRNVATGQLGHVPADKAELFLKDPDYRVAEQSELEQAKRAAANRTFSGQAETALMGAAESVGDVAQLGIRLGQTAAGKAMASLTPSGILASAVGDKVGAALASKGVDLTDPGRSIVGQTLGATLGGTAEQDYAARARELHEANPTAWGAGELVGNVGLGLLTGGTTTAAGKAIAGGLARSGLKSAIAEAAGTGLAMAAEGGFYGAAGAETQARLAGKTTGASAEELMQGIGFGALLGGGIGVAGSATMTAFRKLVAKADELGARPNGASALDSEAGGVAKAFDSEGAAASDAVAELQHKLTGADLDTLKKYGVQNNSAEAIEGRELYRNRRALVDEAVPRMTESLDAMDQAIESVTTNVKQFDLKVSGVSRMLEGVDQVKAKRVGMAHLRGLQANLADVAASIPAGKLTSTTKTRVDNVLHYITSHFDALDDASTAADVYVASDFVKRELQSAQKALKWTATHANDGTKREIAMKVHNRIEEELQEPFRSSLESESTWGRAGLAQRRINAKWKEFLDNSDRYNKELTVPAGALEWPDGRPRYYADTAKVQSWLEGIGTARGKTSQEIVRARIKASHELLDTIAEYHPLNQIQLEKLNKARAGYAELSKDLENLDKTVGIANEIETAARAERELSSLTAPLGGRVLGTITGAVTAGPMGGALGALGLLNRPVAAMIASEQIRAMADRVGIKTISGASKWVKTGLSGTGDKVARVASKVAREVAPRVERGAATARKVAAPAAVALFQGKAKDLESAYEHRTSQLLAAQSSPEALLERVSRVTGGLESVDPDLAGALLQKAQGAIAYLTSKMPGGTIDPTALEPQRKAIIPRLEMMRYARIWSAVEKPLSVVEDLQKGVATPEQIEALRACHPDTYQAIRVAVQDELLEAARKGRRVPLAMRQQLDLLLDLGGAGEPAFAPALVDRVKALQGAEEKRQPTPNRKPPKLSQSVTLPQQSWPSAS